MQKLTHNHVDIAICGAGPVGLTLAMHLVKRGAPPARIILIDAKTLEQCSQDPRTIALSYGSGQILEQVGAWNEHSANAATAIHQIHVSRQGYFGRALIDCKEQNVPALGYVARYGTIVASLTAAASAAGIPILRPVKLIKSTEHEDRMELALDDDQILSADILVQAEGGLFSDQTGKSLRRDYHQTAIIAHVHTSAPIAKRAFERFTDEGPLALLPQDDGYALVWCVKPARSAQLLALPDSEFLKELECAFGSRLGHFIKTTRRHDFALGLNAHLAPSTKPSRTIAIGNAAQTLHPVAGQGLNLGLRDATVLARLLAQETTPAMLQRYHAARAPDRNMTRNLTDTMARIFTRRGEKSFAPIRTPTAPLQALLGASLGMMDVFNPMGAKNLSPLRLLAELMMFGRR